MEGIVPPIKPFPKCLEGQDHASDARVRPVAAPHLGEVIEEVANNMLSCGPRIQRALDS